MKTTSNKSYTTVISKHNLYAIIKYKNLNIISILTTTNNSTRDASTIKDMMGT